ALGLARSQGFLGSDEAELVERSGHPVARVEGSPTNLKITSGDDFELAEAIAERGSTGREGNGVRVGVGYDVHPLVPGRPLILGGVRIPIQPVPWAIRTAISFAMRLRTRFWEPRVSPISAISFPTPTRNSAAPAAWTCWHGSGSRCGAPDSRWPTWTWSWWPKRQSWLRTGRRSGGTCRGPWAAAPSESGSRGSGERGSASWAARKGW